MPKHIPAPDTPAHRLATFQSIVDDSAVARDASGKALETGAFRSAFWFKDFRRPLGWSPAPGVTTSWELFLRGVNLPGPGVSVGSDKPYLGVREPHRTGPYSKWISYGEAKSISEACGAAIIGLCGLKPQVPGQVWNNDQSTIEEITGDKIAFYTPNCPQWRLADLACTAYDFVSVPLFPNTDPVGIKHMFTLCKIRLVFCHLDQLQKVEAVESPFLNYIVVIPSRDGSGLVTSAISDSFKSRNPHIKGIWNWDEFVDYGRKNPVPVSPATHPDEILTICFTSGSTGLPKGG